MKEYQNWFKQAEADIKTAKNSLNSKDYYASVFWSQQAVEKALKAFLIKRDKELIKIHDLVILGRKVGLTGDLLLKCEKLTRAYIETRYGIIDEEIPSKKFKQKDSIKFFKIAEDILKWLKKKI